MAINWSLANAGQFDYLESLQQLGNVQAQRQRLDQQERQRDLAQRTGAQVQAGDYAGAQSEALRGGNLDLAAKIGGLQADQRERLSQEASVMAGVTTRLRALPADQREAEYARVAPVLLNYGFSNRELSDFDLSDAGLDAYGGMAKSVLDGTDKQDEPSVIRSLRLIGIDPQSPEGRDIVTRSLAAPRLIPNGDGTYEVFGGGSSYAAPSPTASRAPAAGTVEGGYRFKGGNPADPSAWEPVGGAPSQGGATFR